MHSTDRCEQTLNTRLVFFSLAGLVAYALVYFIWGEKLPVAGGLGWDGLAYAAYATHFLQEITTTSDVYHVTRIFPSLLIYGVTSLLGIKLATAYAVFLAFYILNNMMFLAAGYLWYKICKLKGFNTYIYLIGFISLFINYACLKLAQYAPVFVDPCVLCFGMLVLFFYLKRCYVSMAIVVLPLFFTWPIVIMLVLPLMIYTFSDSAILKASSAQKINAFIVVSLFIGYLCALLYILVCQSQLVPDWVSLSYSWNHAWWPASRHRPSWIYFILPVSIVIASIYVYFIALNSAIFNVLKNSYRVYLPNVALYSLLIALCWGLFYWLSHLSANYTGKTLFSGAEFLALTALGSIAKPALNLIMHTTFFGPCAILWLVYMRSIFLAANEERFGLLLFVIITYLMALNAHSRQLTFSIPFMIYLLCKVLDNLRMINHKIQFLLAYTAAALIGSKIYYLINVAPLQGGILSYPFQRFFMNFGLWTIWSGYLFNVILAILMCLFLYLGFYKNITDDLPLAAD